MYNKFLLCCLILCVSNIQKCYMIYTPGEYDQKPAPTAGIKTFRQTPNHLQYHHNYSKVYTTNPSSKLIKKSVYIITENDEEGSQKFFPVYNGHTYGQTPIDDKHFERIQIRRTNNHMNNSREENIKKFRDAFEVAGKANQKVNFKIVTNKVKKEISKQIEVYSKCPSGVTGQFVYDKSCNQFLNCWKGRGIVQNCSPGTLFNPKSLECDFPDKVECITGPRLNSINVRQVKSDNLVTQADCPAGFVGMIPNYTDCSKFINCNNGFKSSMDCPPGTLFDTSKNMCDHASNAICFNGKSEVIFVQPNVQQELYSGSQTQQYIDQGQYGQDQSQTGYSQANQNVYQSSYGNLHQTNSKLDFGGTSSCDPNTQNCNQQNSGQNGYYHVNKGQSQQYYNQGQNGYSQTNQNVYQSSYGNAHQTNSKLNFGGCDPNTQNCNQQNSGQNKGQTQQYYNQNGYSQTNQNFQQSNFGSGKVQHVNSKLDFGTTSSCDPRTQNCNQQNNGVNGYYVVNKGQQVYTTNGGYNFNNPQSSGQQVTSVSGGYNFKPQTSGHTNGYTIVSNYGSNAGTNEQVYGNSKPQPYGQTGVVGQQTQNYHTVCNINNPNCHNSGSASSNTQQVKCPNGVQGVQEHPYDCSKFLNCANGQTFIQDCPPGTLFSKNLKTCDYSYKVNCQAKSTTTYETLDTDIYEGNVGSKVTWGVENNNQGNQRGFGEVNQNINWDNQAAGTVNIGYGKPTYRPIAQQSTTTYRPVRVSENYETLDVDQNIEIGQKPQDYDDIVNTNYNQYTVTPTTITQKSWPPSFPENPPTDTNADYAFGNEDAYDELVHVEVHNPKPKKSSSCEKDDFHCTRTTCVAKTSICDGIKDCSNGKDELDCKEYLEKFAVYKGSKLAVNERERWNNVNFTTCAVLCLENTKFDCKSFNYRTVDKTCFLSDSNIGLSGMLISYYPCDYYEMKSHTVDCTNLHKCNNNKCISKTQICDGFDDCDDRSDEKFCLPKDIGYEITLAGSDKKHEGRIEILAFGKKGYVCDDKFGLRDANVVCKELGFSLGATEVRGNSFFARDIMENNTFYMMDDVDCNGNETSLKDCDFGGWGVHDCLNQEIAGVICKIPQEKCPQDYWKCDTGNECLPQTFVCDGLLDCTDNSDEADHNCEAPIEVRLAGSSTPNQGRIEIKYHGLWGTVCDDDFNEDAAKVVCRKLGYKGSSIVKKEAFFGEGSGPIWLDQVYCFGNESSLEQCTHWNFGEHNCDHSEDVGVICSNSAFENYHVTEKSIKPVSLSIYPNSCGYRKDNQFLLNDDVHFRVVKGSTARSGDYPWQAAVKVKTNLKPAHWCGAIIISSKFVLTAAHCLTGYAKGSYMIIAGDYNVDLDEGTEQTDFIEEYFIHQNFREGHKMNNDIALVKVKRGFVLNQDVQPICLPEADTDYETALNCTISGFGSTQSGSSGFSHDLRAGWIPLQPSSVCKMPHVYGKAMTEGMFCAGYLDEGIDACDGDSGGPLACLKDGLFTLYGITSWGQHCGYANKPGVYVKVAYYRQWIDDILRNNS